MEALQPHPVGDGPVGRGEVVAQEGDPLGVVDAAVGAQPVGAGRPFSVTVSGTSP